MSALLLAVLCDLAVSTTGGYGVGSLKTDESIRVTAFPVTLSVKYEGPIAGYGQFVTGGVFQRHDLSYEEEGAAFTGANILYGLSFGTLLYKPAKGFFRLEGAYYMSTGLTVASESEGTVNGKSYRHSTLQTYTGPGAFEISSRYIIEKTDRAYNRLERLRFGFGLAYLQQSLTEVVTQVAVSDPKVAPRGRTRAPAAFSYSVTALDVMIGYAF